MSKVSVYDVVFVGGGASTLFCASLIKNKKVAILESNHKCGAKLEISGGGKCNITNKIVSSSNFIGDREFIENALKHFDNKKLLEYLEKSKINYKESKRVVDGQIFLDSSKILIKHLLFENKQHDIFTSTKVLSVSFDGIYTIFCENKTLQSKQLVIASGGISYPSVGISDIGYKIGEYFGHTITTATPALVGFTVQKDEFWWKELAGISTEITISIGEKRFQGEMLFTHKGCSGPAILNSSLYWEKGKMEIDFLCGRKAEELLKNGDSKKQISSILPLPKRFIKSFLSTINLEDKKIPLLNKAEIQKLSLLNSYPFSPAGKLGFYRAEITKGGIKSSELYHDTMESKKQKGLYFIGEVIDVNGELGGYNLQWAFCSGYICAENLRKMSK